MKKRIIIISVLLILLALAWILASGFTKRGDVSLLDYSLSEKGDEITLQIGVASSMGYVRAYVDKSQEANLMELEFYSAFGGLNGSIGAKNEFVIPLNPQSNQIYFYHNDGFDLVLKKNQDTGEWVRPD